MSDKKDNLGDRMKELEDAYARRVMPLVPVCARLDGRCFSGFTRGLARPFDLRMSSCMIDLAIFLVSKTSALVAYTQSDEISLAWLDVPFFDGNPQKMCSTLAAMASVRLNLQAFVTTSSDGTIGKCATHREAQSGLRWSSEPTFDCRAWVVPSLVEAANVFMWRQQDASRNSVQMAARHHFSHKACDNLNGKQLQEKLHAEAGINWNNYPTQFKRGTFVKHAKTQRAFTPEELADLPPLHDARKDPNLVVERRVLVECDLDLRSIEDRPSALFTDAAM